MSIEYRINKIREAIAKYPVLAIELTEEQIYNGRVIYYAGITSHQKEACRLAGKLSGWHPTYVAQMCPQSRPPLFEETSRPHTPGEWDQKCQWWQAEHEKPVEVLAREFAEHMNTGAVERCLEPIGRHSDGVKMSEHDNNTYDARYPCPVGEW